MPKLKTKEVYWSPPDFSPEEFLPDHLKKHAKYARLFVHIIKTRTEIYGRLGENGYVNLKRAYLDKSFPKGVFTKIRDALRMHGVVECDDRYIEGKKSFGYRLAEEYSEKAERIETDDPELVKRLLYLKKDRVRADTKAQKHLYKCLKKVEIEGELGDIDEKQHFSFLMIRHKEFFLISDDYGRVHTNITNLKRNLRERLRVKNKKLVNLDVRNSQPLIFALFMRQHNFDSPDAKFFIQRCEQGIFYDHLMNLANIPAERRDDYKIEFFTDVFYGPNRTDNDNWKLFEQCYPGVAKFIWDYKKATEENKEKYKELARNLQKIESGIIIDGIIEECRENHIDIWVSTIHDSILTTPEYVDIIKEIIFAHFNKNGLNPKVKEERYGS